MGNEAEKLQFAKEILDNRHTCSNCYFWSSHCTLYSCTCATAVGNRAVNPPRWMSFEEGEGAERKD